MQNQTTTLQDALDTRFFAPLHRPRTRRVGVELEFPVWNRTPGKGTDFAAVHAATDDFLARFPDGGAPSIEKEPVSAVHSALLESLLADPVEERSLVAHIRLATIGHIEYENCHPFTATDNSGRIWTLAHNGTIFNGAYLNDYMGIQHGDTDSERVLLYLVDQINVAQNHRCRALDEAERFDVLFGAIAELAQGNKLNLLIFDGEVLYAHCNFRDTLHVWRDTDGVAFSTRPLSMGTWAPVPFTSLVAAKDGEIVRTSPPHGNEYIYNPEDYRLVYMNFARL